MMMLVDSEKIIEVTALPKQENPAHSFHKWICIDGIGIDITLGQFYPNDVDLKSAVLFSTHPFENSGEYIIEKSNRQISNSS